VGQGNGAGPAILVAISAVIIQMLYTAGFGLTLNSAISGTLVAIACFAFVNDADVIHSKDDVNTPGEIIAAKMQDFVDLWEGSIRATG
jgi:predicted nuclease with TOPRIM domain